MKKNWFQIVANSDLINCVDHHDSRLSIFVLVRGHSIILLHKAFQSFLFFFTIYEMTFIDERRKSIFVNIRVHYTAFTAKTSDRR